MPLPPITRTHGHSKRWGRGLSCQKKREIPWSKEKEDTLVKRTGRYLGQKKREIPWSQEKGDTLVNVERVVVAGEAIELCLNVKSLLHSCHVRLTRRDGDRRSLLAARSSKPTNALQEHATHQSHVDLSTHVDNLGHSVEHGTLSLRNKGFTRKRDLVSLTGKGGIVNHEALRRMDSFLILEEKSSSVFQCAKQEQRHSAGARPRNTAVMSQLATQQL